LNDNTWRQLIKTKQKEKENTSLLCKSTYNNKSLNSCSYYISIWEEQNFFLNPMPPHVPYGLCGLPSWLWLKCNRLLRLGCSWGMVTLSRWGGWWYMNMEYQEGP
jgi:hypothetical protein